jgi:hypothetical protein
MAEFRVIFHECIQDSQEYGSNDEHMVSRVFFSLEVDGRRVGDFSADLKQVVGGDIEHGEIEVGPPHNYDGPFDHTQFAEAARKYFRSLVGSQGTGIRMEGSTNVRMRNNRFRKEAEFRFTSGAGPERIEGGRPRKHGRRKR